MRAPKLRIVSNERHPDFNLTYATCPYKGHGGIGTLFPADSRISSRTHGRSISGTLEDVISGMKLRRSSSFRSGRICTDFVGSVGTPGSSYYRLSSCPHHSPSQGRFSDRVPAAGYLDCRPSRLVSPHHNSRGNPIAPTALLSVSLVSRLTYPASSSGVVRQTFG
eukprot:sb/3472533/